MPHRGRAEPRRDAADRHAGGRECEAGQRRRDNRLLRRRSEREPGAELSRALGDRARHAEIGMMRRELFTAVKLNHIATIFT